MHLIKLSSGRSFRANRGILGLAPDGDDLYEGYDGMVDEWDLLPESEEQPPLTRAERLEIAEMMIVRWFRWGAL